MNIGHVKARQRHTVQMSIKGIPLPYACKSSLASPTLVLPLLMFSLYPHLSIMSSPLTLHVAKALPKSPLQSHSTGSFRCLHYILWPPRRADSTETPLVCFSLACGNVPRTAVSFGNSLVYPPLPSQCGMSHAEMIGEVSLFLLFYYHFAFFKFHIHISVFDFFSFLFFSFLFIYFD